MKYIEIGNENGGPAYDERYALFYDAIKATYPDIKIVANVPTRQRPTEILDEHYYSLPEFFMANAFRYDTYDRKGSHIYVGEYAVTQNAGQGNLRAAVGEAAFMTGMERNADVVVMSSYAPLFVNPGWRRWNPNAIVFDASRCLRNSFLPRAVDVCPTSTRCGTAARVEVTATQHAAARRTHWHRDLGHAGRIQGHSGRARREDTVGVRSAAWSAGVGNQLRRLGNRGRCLATNIPQDAGLRVRG